MSASRRPQAGARPPRQTAGTGSRPARRPPWRAGRSQQWPSEARESPPPAGPRQADQPRGQLQGRRSTTPGRNARPRGRCGCRWSWAGRRRGARGCRCSPRCGWRSATRDTCRPARLRRWCPGSTGSLGAGSDSPRGSPCRRRRARRPARGPGSGRGRWSGAPSRSMTRSDATSCSLRDHAASGIMRPPG